MMTEVMAGCSNTQRRATCAGERAHLVGYREKRLQGLVGIGGKIALRVGPSISGTRAFQGALAGLVLAGEEAAAERTPHHHAQSLELTNGNQLLLNVAHDQAVLRLIALKARQAIRV